ASCGAPPLLFSPRQRSSPCLHGMQLNRRLHHTGQNLCAGSPAFARGPASGGRPHHPPRQTTTTLTPDLRIRSNSSGSAPEAVISISTADKGAMCAAATLPTLLLSATATTSVAARTIACLISASGRLELVTPYSAEMPLQPRKSKSALILEMSSVPKGLTSECCL